jgi:hypothetical protein
MCDCPELPDDAFMIVVVHSSSQTGGEYVATGCQVVSNGATTAVATCQTTEGIGRGLVWRVTIAGQQSGFAGNTSYGRPTISQFTGSGSFGALTDGDQVVRIHGRNFGPLGTPVHAYYAPGMVATAVIPASPVAIHPPFGPLSEPEIAVYGDDGDYVAYPGLNCTVYQAHLVVQCTTASGAGFGLTWVIAVGNQTSQSPVTSYSPPNIDSIDVVDGESVLSVVCVVFDSESVDRVMMSCGGCPSVCSVCRYWCTCHNL